MSNIISKILTEIMPTEHKVIRSTAKTFQLLTHGYCGKDINIGDVIHSLIHDYLYQLTYVDNFTNIMIETKGQENCGIKYEVITNRTPLPFIIPVRFSCKVKIIKNQHSSKKYQSRLVCFCKFCGECCVNTDLYGKMISTNQRCCSMERP